MAKGISLHIGLNYVDPNHYGGWDGKLNAAEFDALDMYSIATAQGFQATKLIRENATRDALIQFITNSSTVLSSGDILLISYSGHGGQIPDMNNDEEDGLDETWCLFNGEILDDELGSLWSLFKSGVRILIVSDSCHSKTVAKRRFDDLISPISDFQAKAMPHEIALTTYLQNKEFYDRIFETLKDPKDLTISASVKTLSGCQDNQSSYDGEYNGEFTGKLKRVWNGGKFNGDYYTFHKKILNNFPPYQTPGYSNVGEQNPMFDRQKPFSI